MNFYNDVVNDENITYHNCDYKQYFNDWNLTTDITYILHRNARLTMYLIAQPHTRIQIHTCLVRTVNSIWPYTLYIIPYESRKLESFFYWKVAFAWGPTSILL